MYIDDTIKRLNKLSENQKKMYDYGYLLGVITGKVYQKQIVDCNGTPRYTHTMHITHDGVMILLVPHNNDKIQTVRKIISLEELETLVAIVKEIQAEEKNEGD